MIQFVTKLYLLFLYVLVYNNNIIFINGGKVVKKNLFMFVCVAVSAIILSLSVLLSIPTVKTVNSVENDNVASVLTVSNSPKSEPDNTKILETRFLNMLKRNFVYDSAFDTVESVVNSSIPALLDMRETDDSSYISQDIVSDFVYSMYGIEIEDFSSINADWPQKEGYLFIIPNGYEKLNHQIISINENEDGTYTVKTRVTISSHDGLSVTDVCETLFVKNDSSQFGFNIVYSNIGVSAASL